MIETKNLHLQMSEEQFDKLVARARAAQMTPEQFVLSLVESDSTSSLNRIEQAMEHMEGLIWMNMYWSSLPFTEGLPKQRLKDEGVAHYWDNSMTFAQKFHSLTNGAEPEQDS